MRVIFTYIYRYDCMYANKEVPQCLSCSPIIMCRCVMRSDEEEVNKSKKMDFHIKRNPAEAAD